MGSFFVTEILIQGLGRRYLITKGMEEFFLSNFTNTGDFNPGLGSTILTDKGNGDIFVTKFNNAGNFVWAHAFGAQDIDSGDDIAATATDVYITGQFYDEVNFATSGSHFLQSYGISG